MRAVLSVCPPPSLKAAIGKRVVALSLRQVANLLVVALRVIIDFTLTFSGRICHFGLLITAPEKHRILFADRITIA